MTGPVYNLVWLVFGTLYPAYNSFKAVKSKNAKNYVRWMMYWIVYALFVASESLLDPLLNFWLPFYGEAKVIFLLYLVSSSTRGSSVIYKGWIHPVLSSNEAEIDIAIEKLKLKSFQTAKSWIKTGMQKVAGFVTNTALKSGGGLVQQLQRSYSMVDLTDMGNILAEEMSVAQEKTEIDEKTCHITSRMNHITSRMKHYKSEECLYNPSHSSIGRLRSPDMMLSNTSISSGYSTDSLLPTFDDQDEKIDETKFCHYEAIQMRAEEIMRREAQLDQMMMTRQRTKRKLQGKERRQNEREAIDALGNTN